jgi:hypothetical protein
MAKNPFYLKKKPVIEVVATLDGLYEDESIRPMPASKFLPKWWNKIPLYADQPFFSSLRKPKTIKTCPSFAHYFSKGIVIPAWCDITFQYNKEDGSVSWATGGEGSGFKIESHPNWQFLDYGDYTPFAVKSTAIMKLISPWNIITPKGWSVFQLPMYYENGRNWSVMPGIIDTDVHHQINQQVALTDSDQEVFIAKGEPLCVYIPFKREKEKYVVRAYTQKDIKRFTISNFKLVNQARRAYLDMPRSDD